MSFNLMSGTSYTLLTAITSSQTTIPLTSFTVPVSGAPITMALMNTDIAYMTIGPKTATSEFISFTGITQNGDGSATLTGVVRGLNKTSPFTTSGTFQLAHNAGVICILSNMPQIFNKFASLENDNTYTGVQTFNGNVVFSTTSLSGTNLSVNNLIEGYTTTATSASTTVLTSSSTNHQYFTGATTQTVVLPVTSTLTTGWSYTIHNESSGLVTVQSSGLNSILILAGGTSATFICILASGTSAASWDYDYLAIVGATGKKLTVSNILTLAGTDATTMTFPTTSATIARTDAGNTFTGNQLVTGSVLSSSASAGVGYTTGAGVAASQSSSKSTTVVANGICGTITMNNASLNANTAVSFTFTNSSIAALDFVGLSIKSAASNASYNYNVDATAAGSCLITVKNVSGGALGEAVVFNFVIIKSVAA